MRAIIQRVNKASVIIKGDEYAKIGRGILIFLGVATEDTSEDSAWLAAKIANLRIFDDSTGQMNQSVKELSGDILVVSQFTLQASTKKGNRPSYMRAAKPHIATFLYEQFITNIEKLLGKSVKTGKFGAKMQVSLLNDGPVTLIIDTKNKE